MPEDLHERHTGAEKAKHKKAKVLPEFPLTGELKPGAYRFGDHRVIVEVARKDLAIAHVEYDYFK